jgi:hypothetical protein
MDIYSIEPHLKRGYRKFFDLDMARLDAFIAEFESPRCMAVMRTEQNGKQAAVTIRGLCWFAS